MDNSEPDPDPVLLDRPCPSCDERTLWVENRADPRPIGAWPWYVCRSCGHAEIGRVAPWCAVCQTWHDWHDPCPAARR
jgi:hypothetical protein